MFSPAETHCHPAGHRQCECEIQVANELSVALWLAVRDLRAAERPTVFLGWLSGGIWQWYPQEALGSQKGQMQAHL